MAPSRKPVPIRILFAFVAWGCASGVSEDRPEWPPAATISASDGAHEPGAHGCPPVGEACEEGDLDCPSHADLDMCAACPWEADGECDVPQLCPPDTDVEDCTSALAGSSSTGDDAHVGSTGLSPDEPDPASPGSDGSDGSDGSGGSDGAPARPPACSDADATGACARCAQGACCAWLAEAAADPEASCVSDCMLTGTSVVGCGRPCDTSDPLSEPGITDLFVCLSNDCAGQC